MSDLLLSQLVLRYARGELSLRAFHKWATQRALDTDFSDPTLNKLLGLLTVAEEFPEDEFKERVVGAVLPTTSRYRALNVRQTGRGRGESAIAVVSDRLKNLQPVT